MSAFKVKDAGGSTIDMIDVGGFIASKFKPPSGIEKLFDNTPNFKFRDDDVMLCTYPKTGTHLTFDMLLMILKKSAAPVQGNKLMPLWQCQSLDDMNKLPSPRVINSHNPLRYLPVKGIKEKQIKTVLCCRNPKDTVVSFYNHMRGVKYYSYDGKWDDWLPLYLEGKLAFGKYSDYLLEWEKAMKGDVGFPLHVVYYEDLQLDTHKEMDRLLKFLGVELDDKLKRDIVKECRFDVMASKPIPKEVVDTYFKDDFRIFRKGKIGDWKNWFSDKQNAKFDEMWTEEMKDSSFKFIYTDPRAD
ncbi:sulfotransferase 1B1-like [Ruditapes philippinarum]|uniref:sulfotransferase 1B1-like n=1 Tax=Ruditapes philippinarum TaxID=129788 RepID=UPI00295A7C08|nr:sulfotransferase 1B1-like [Ruditapes philippinarum]